MVVVGERVEIKLSCQIRECVKRKRNGSVTVSFSFARINCTVNVVVYIFLCDTSSPGTTLAVRMSILLMTDGRLTVEKGRAFFCLLSTVRRTDLERRSADTVQKRFIENVKTKSLSKRKNPIFTPTIMFRHSSTRPNGIFPSSSRMKRKQFASSKETPPPPR